MVSMASAAKPVSMSSMGERLILIEVIPQADSSAACSDANRQTDASWQRPRRAMSPSLSAASMNSSAGILPSSGWVRRLSTSKLVNRSSLRE